MGWDGTLHRPSQDLPELTESLATPAPTEQKCGGEVLKIQGLKVEVTCQILPTCQDPQLPG